jgi:NADPH-dependent curcumin reductase CurA
MFQLHKHVAAVAHTFLTLCCLRLCPLALQDVAAIRRCKWRVFQLHKEGKLQAWVDDSHGFKGVEQIPDAIEYMLQGGHIGKVVIPLE